ncbi:MULTISPECIES: hypothetical protein [unclassified Microcoleus]|uniref:hypothetical protein n=1 Tax=unclassified Microcoleus TaxID=2642155 RepID=UPI002FD163D2
MQITISSGDTVSDVLDKFVSLFCVNESELNSLTDSQYLRLRSPIYELKEIADFLLSKFAVDLAAPKRNSKVSLADWISTILLSAREAADVSEATEQIADTECPDCGFVHEPFQNTLCPDGEPKPQIIEVLEPEEKPVYTISILEDGGFSEERVNHLPPFLIDRKGKLLKKFWHRSCDAGYSEITSKHLSGIAVGSGLVITLMADSLEISQACICGDPPFFILDKGGVYKRDRVRGSLAVTYSQVISEHLSNIVVVSL